MPLSEQRPTAILSHWHHLSLLFVNRDVLTYCHTDTIFLYSLWTETYCHIVTLTPSFFTLCEQRPTDILSHWHHLSLLLVNRDLLPYCHTDTIFLYSLWTETYCHIVTLTPSFFTPCEQRPTAILSHWNHFSLLLVNRDLLPYCHTDTIFLYSLWTETYCHTVTLTPSFFTLCEQRRTAILSHWHHLSLLFVNRDGLPYCHTDTIFLYSLCPACCMFLLLSSKQCPVI